jgi:group I intron endonuclease
MYCIYQITNKINGHRYIGQHKYEDESNPMEKYKGSGLILHQAYKKYGIENFETEILYKRVRDKATIDTMEIWAIEKYKPEYNIAKGGSGGITQNMTEFNRNQEIIKKRVDTFKKNHHIPPNKGKKCSDTTKKKISDVRKSRYWSNKGYHKTPEQIENWRKNYIGRHYYTNGIINVIRFECPEGFWPGRTCVKVG